jgi:hypothetical protein
MMYRQLTLNEAAAVQARDAGMRKVWDRTSGEWRGFARAFARAHLLTLPDGAEVTPDQIRASIPTEPHSPNSWGPFYLHLVSLGWLSFARRTARSAQERGHGNKNEVYVVHRAALEASLREIPKLPKSKSSPPATRPDTAGAA